MKHTVLKTELNSDFIEYSEVFEYLYKRLHCWHEMPYRLASLVKCIYLNFLGHRLCNLHLTRSMLLEQNECVGTWILCQRWSKFSGGSDRCLFPGSNRYEGRSNNWKQQVLTNNASFSNLPADMFLFKSY